MRIDIHAEVHVHTAKSDEAPPWAVELRSLIIGNQEQTMATLDDLVQKVTDLGTVEQGVVALLTDISARLKAAGQDQAKLDALAAALDAQKQALSDAVTANTPAA